MKEKKGFFTRLKEGLTKTRDSLVAGIDSIFKGFSEIDEDFYEELEEVLIMADIGVATTEKIIENLREKVKEQKIKEIEVCRKLLIDSIKEQMRVDETAYDFENEVSVVMIIGVNGVGKTTSVGKLAGQFKSKGKKVVLAAADTFRAAAIEQLTEWAGRAGVDIISGQEGGDPASVVFDAVNAAKARNADVLICDTAGRLHNKKNLMEELKKINRIIDREFPDARRETLVVLDGTTGQNALVQAKQFNEVADITGIILTKLDGDTRGGAALSIKAVTGRPILYVGMGEKLSDLEQFYPDRMASRILGMGDVLTLIEKAEAELDQEKAKEMERKFRKAEFDFNDFLDQMGQMKKMGGIQSILSMLPGMGLPSDIEIDDSMFKGIEAIIYSMTLEERGNPAIINPSRKRRIAKGAGVDISEVNKLMKQYEQSKKMMKQMSGMMSGKGRKKGRLGFPKLPFGL